MCVCFFLPLHGLVRVPADEDHGEVHGSHGEDEVEEAEAVGDVVVLLVLLRILELQAFGVDPGREGRRHDDDDRDDKALQEA